MTLILGLPAGSFADEFEVKEDLTVSGIGGSLRNPNVDVKGNLGIAKDIHLHEGLVSAPFGGIGRYANLLTYSEQLDNAAWVKTNTTVSSTTITAPNLSLIHI